MTNPLIVMVGARGFEPPTPSPPDALPNGVKWHIISYNSRNSQTARQDFKRQETAVFRPGIALLRHIYATDNSPLPGKPPSTRWNQLEVLHLCVFIRSVLLMALKATNGLLTAPILKQRVRPLHDMVRLTCLCPEPAAAFGRYGDYPHKPVLTYGTSNAGRHIKGASPETYSVNERPFQVSFVFIDMGINGGQHRAVTVAHDCGDSEVVVTLNELTGSEAMPSVVGSHALTRHLGKAVHPIADREFRPSFISSVSKQLTLSNNPHELCDDLKGMPLQMNNSGFSLAFGLFFGNDNTPPVKIDVTRLDMTGFLGTAAGVPHKGKKGSKGIMFEQMRHNIFEVFRAHMIVTALRLRLLKLLDGIRIHIAKLVGPVIYPLNRNDSAALVGISPGGVRVDPFNDMVGFKIQRRDASIIAKELAEAVYMAFVPFKATRGAVGFTPCKIFIEKIANCNSIFHDLIIVKRMMKNNLLEFDRV